MTAEELPRLIARYRAGLQAELRLLEELIRIAARQRIVTHAGNLEAFSAAADERDAIMRRLLMFDDGLRGVRRTLTEHRELADTLPGFDEVVALHREAALIVNRILATDKDSKSAISDAGFARLSVVERLEREETTLAAYGRVLAPAAASPSPANPRG